MRSVSLGLLLLMSVAIQPSIPGVMAGAPPYPPDILPARQIVPGERIGPWTLAGGIPGLTRVLGRPAAAAPRPMFDQQPGLTGYAWTLGEGMLIAWSRDGRGTSYLELRDNRSYRTGALIGVGSTNLEVQAAYGTPTVRTAIPGASRYIYDRLGLAAFTQGTSTGFITVAISVFRPGTAIRLWKF